MYAEEASTRVQIVSGYTIFYIKQKFNRQINLGATEVESFPSLYAISMNELDPHQIKTLHASA